MARSFQGAEKPRFANDYASGDELAALDRRHGANWFATLRTDALSALARTSTSPWATRTYRDGASCPAAGDTTKDHSRTATAARHLPRR